MKRAFTIIELTVILGMVATLMAITVINLLQAQQSANIESAMAQLVADIKTQQIRAMTGDTEGTGMVQSYGVYVTPTSYTLFRGVAYDAGEESNFTLNLETNLELETTFMGSQLVFAPGSGEVMDYASGADTITLTETSGPTSAELQFNRYGVVISDY